jgi:hypothetical protein
VPAAQRDKIARILARLNEAVIVQDMGLPGLQASSPEGRIGRFLVRDRIRQLADHFSIRGRRRLRCRSH